MAGGTDNNQLKAEAKTRWRWQQQWRQRRWHRQQRRWPQRWCIDDSGKDDTFGICLAEKDCNIALAFPFLLPLPPPPLLPPPLSPPLCQNVGNNGNDYYDNNKEKTMMGRLCVLVVRVVYAGCVSAACPCYFGRLPCICAPKRWQTTAYWRLPERSFQDKLTHCI